VHGGRKNEEGVRGRSIMMCSFELEKMRVKKKRGDRKGGVKIGHRSSHEKNF